MTLTAAPFHDDVAEGPKGGAAYWISSADAVRIRVAAWPKPDAKGTVLVFPGRTEYAEKYGRGAADLAQRGYATLAIDWRGQGLSDRATAEPLLGHVEDFAEYQLDVTAMLAAADALNMPKPFVLLAHSMGGCIGLRALLNGLPVKACAFTGPMWEISMSAVLRPATRAVSWASRQVGVSTTLASGSTTSPYVLANPFDGNSLTTDPDMYRYMQDQVRSYPDLGLGGPSMQWLNQALDETQELAAAASPDLPCLTFVGSFEQIVEIDHIKTRMKNWPNGQLIMVDGGEHEVLMERPQMRETVYDQIAAHFDNSLAQTTV